MLDTDTLLKHFKFGRAAATTSPVPKVGEEQLYSRGIEVNDRTFWPRGPSSAVTLLASLVLALWHVQACCICVITQAEHLTREIDLSIIIH